MESSVGGRSPALAGHSVAAGTRAAVLVRAPGGTLSGPVPWPRGGAIPLPHRTGDMMPRARPGEAHIGAHPAIFS